MHTTFLLAVLFALGADEPAPAPSPAPAAPEAPATAPAPAVAPDAAPVAAPAAAKDLIQKITLRDGQVMRGRITEERRDTVVLKLRSGDLVEVRRASIAKVEEEEAAAGGGDDPWFIDPNRTRYLYAPSAMMLRPGECYFSQKELILSSISCGVTPNVSVLLGTVLPAWFFTPFTGSGMNAIAALKVGMPVGDLLHLAAGFESLILPRPGGVVVGGFAFASATVGNPNAHATLSMGRPFSFLPASSSSGLGDLLVVASGDLRLTPGFSLVTENWFMPSFSSSWGLLSVNALAARFIGLHWTVDFGVVSPSLSIPWYFVPWLDFTYSFG